jgi:hypothetical protein
LTLIQIRQMELEINQKPDNEIITLNVGGELMQTFKFTLLLSKYFKSKFEHWDKETTTSSERKPIFLDFDPKIFRHVLNMLRDPEYEIPPKKFEHVKKMALHFGFKFELENTIPDLEIGKKVIQTIETKEETIKFLHYENIVYEGEICLEYLFSFHFNFSDELLIIKSITFIFNNNYRRETIDLDGFEIWERDGTPGDKCIVYNYYPLKIKKEYINFINKKLTKETILKFDIWLVSDKRSTKSIQRQLKTDPREIQFSLGINYLK